MAQLYTWQPRVLEAYKRQLAVTILTIDQIFRVENDTKNDLSILGAIGEQQQIYHRLNLDQEVS